LAQQALRLLGVRVVPLDDSPTLTEMVPSATIATMALVELGVIATDDVTPPQGTIVAPAAVATTALIKLGVIASDETPLASDQALALAAVNAVHASLVAQSSVDWTTAGITTAVSEEYAGLTAAHIASSFGKASDPALVPLLEKRIATVSMVSRAQALAVDKVASVHAALDAQGVIWWDGTAVPRAFVEEFTKLAAAQMASSFGKSVAPEAVALLEARVRKGAMVLSADDNATQAVMDVHNDLAMRGIARWSSQDIPDAVGNSYVVLAADALAPLFERKTDPKDAAMAMVALFRYVALPTSGERVVVEYF